MNKRLLIVSSITYAMKGRDILNKHKFKAFIRRISNANGPAVCGYGILVSGDITKAAQLLACNGIEVLDRIDTEVPQ